MFSPEEEPNLMPELKEEMNKDSHKNGIELLQGYLTRLESRRSLKLKKKCTLDDGLNEMEKSMAGDIEENRAKFNFFSLLPGNGYFEKRRELKLESNANRSIRNNFTSIHDAKDGQHGMFVSEEQSTNDPDKFLESMMENSFEGTDKQCITLIPKENLSLDECHIEPFVDTISSDSSLQKIEKENAPGSINVLELANHVASSHPLPHGTPEKHSRFSSVETMYENSTSDGKENDSEEDDLSHQVLDSHGSNKIIITSQSVKDFDNSESEASDSTSVIKYDKKLELTPLNKVPTKDLNRSSVERESKKNSFDESCDEILDAPVGMICGNFMNEVIFDKIQEAHDDSFNDLINKVSSSDENDEQNFLPEYFKFCEIYPFARNGNDVLKVFSKSPAPRATWTTTRHDIIKWMTDEPKTNGEDENKKEIQEQDSGTPKDPIMMLRNMIQSLQSLLCCHNFFQDCFHGCETPIETEENNDVVYQQPDKDEILVKPPSPLNEEKYCTTSV